MHVYEVFDEEIPVTRPSQQPDDDDPTLDAPRGYREENDESAGGRSPRPQGGYVIRLPGLRDIDWGW